MNMELLVGPADGTQGFQHAWQWLYLWATAPRKMCLQNT